MILNASEGSKACSKSSSVSSVSQGTPVPLKSLLRDHNGGGWEGGQNPGATNKIKNPVDLTRGSSCFCNCGSIPFAPSLQLATIQWGSWESPCAVGLGRETVGKCPFYFLQAKVVWTVVSTGKKAKTLVQIVQMFGFCTSFSDTSQGFS